MLTDGKYKDCGGSSRGTHGQLKHIRKERVVPCRTVHSGCFHSHPPPEDGLCARGVCELTAPTCTDGLGVGPGQVSRLDRVCLLL